MALQCRTHIRLSGVDAVQCGLAGCSAGRLTMDRLTCDAIDATCDVTQGTTWGLINMGERLSRKAGAHKASAATGPPS